MSSQDIDLEGIEDCVTGTIWGLDGVVSLISPITAVETAVIRQQKKDDTAAAAKSIAKIPQERAEISRKYAVVARADPSLRVAGSGSKSKKSDREPVFLMPRSGRRKRS